MSENVSGSSRQYTTIVVGTDGSSLSKPTVARAATIAVDEDADLVIVCAYTPMSRRAEAKSASGIGDTKFDQVPGRDAALQALKQAQELAVAIGARTVATELVDADAVAALLHVGKQRLADLIVIGAIRDRSIAGRLLGTVATQVIQRAHCDVLVIRPSPQDPEPNRPESEE